MRSILVTLVLSAWPAFAVMPKKIWSCQISALLAGSGQHFLYYGRDAWNGDGFLYCESGNQDVFRKVAVSFNSMIDGFGSDRNSHLQLIVDLATQQDPNDLQIRALVVNRKVSPKVQWLFNTELNEAQVFVTTYSPNAAARSLQRGTLFIRSSGD